MALQKISQIFYLSLFVLLSQVAAESAYEQVMKQSASYRRQQFGYVNDAHHPDELKHPFVRQETAQDVIIATLSDNYEHPVNEFIERQLQTDYRSCSDALGDIVTWFLVLYGDWYGNKSSNTLGYYIYHLINDKIPEWVYICSQDYTL